MSKELKNELNVMLNSISLNEDDPTLLNCKFIVLDFEVSGNNVIVGRNEGLELGKTIKGKPIRTLYKEQSSLGTKDDDFGDHEAELSVDRNGKDYMKRNTIPIGVFTSEGYVEEVEINGELKEVLVADAHLWYSQFKEPIQLLIDWFEQGLDIQMSCEYLYSNYEFKDGIEYHKSPLVFEAHTILGKDVTPSYKSAKLLQFNQLEEFNLAVAQALNNKEVNDLEENLQTNEEVVEESTAEEVTESTEEVAVEAQAEEVAEESVVETEDEQVTQLNAKVEELTETISQLNNKIEELTTSKLELVEKFDSATETITQLNSQLEELKPLKEQIELAQKESVLNEAKEGFETKFNSIGANELFATEEIQTLVAQSVELGEVGLNAKLALNEKIVELASKKIEASSNPIQTIMNTVSKRDFKDLINNDNDPLSEYRS